jgi:hypothetical protein
LKARRIDYFMLRIFLGFFNFCSDADKQTCKWHIPGSVKYILKQKELKKRRQTPAPMGNRGFLNRPK